MGVPAVQPAHEQLLPPDLPAGSPIRDRSHRVHGADEHRGRTPRAHPARRRGRAALRAAARAREEHEGNRTLLPVLRGAQGHEQRRGHHVRTDNCTLLSQPRPHRRTGRPPSLMVELTR